MDKHSLSTKWNARYLHRDIEQLKKKLAECQQELDECRTILNDSTVLAEKAINELEKVERERDRLAEALRELLDDIAETESIENTTFVSQWAWDKAKAALDALEDNAKDN